MKPLYDGPERNVATFESLFDAEGLDWALIGGLAAIKWRASTRDTVDVDFVVSDMANLEERLKRLGPAKLRVLREHDGVPYLIQGEMANGMHFDIDVASIEFEKTVLATKDNDHVASAEAILLYKMLAMRPQDVDDIHSILAAHPGFEGLDLDFIGQWADELDVSDRWNGFVSEIWQAEDRKRLPRPPGIKPTAEVGRPKAGYVRKQGVDSLGRRYTRWVRSDRGR